MKSKNSILMILVVMMLSACSSGSSPTGEAAAIADVEEQTTDKTEDLSITEGTGFCSNEFFPLRSDKTWEYTITSGDEVNPYSITFKDITPDSFTALQTFDSLTNEVVWECDANGMLSSTFASMLLSGADVGYETLEVDGTALPPEDEWQVGKSWGIIYRVKLTINSEGFMADVEGEITVSSQIAAIELITVPAGIFDEAYRVDSSGEIVTNIMGTDTTIPMTFSDWYVRGVGLVKSASDDPNMVYLMELISFE